MNKDARGNGPEAETFQTGRKVHTSSAYLVFVALDEQTWEAQARAALARRERGAPATARSEPPPRGSPGAQEGDRGSPPRQRRGLKGQGAEAAGMAPAPGDLYRLRQQRGRLQRKGDVPERRLGGLHLRLQSGDTHGPLVREGAAEV
jgi:hypothetical protein